MLLLTPSTNQGNAVPIPMDVKKQGGKACSLSLSLFCASAGARALMHCAPKGSPDPEQID